MFELIVLGLILAGLAAIARAREGCWGARMTGAGFGGCAVALVRADLAGAFATKVTRAYGEATGRESTAYLCRASDGAQDAR